MPGPLGDDLFSSRLMCFLYLSVQGPAGKNSNISGKTTEAGL